MSGRRNIISLTCVRPARGVTANPAGIRPVIDAVAVPGEQGPGNNAYVDQRLQALQSQIDNLLPPSFDFYRLGMAATNSPTRRS